MTLLRFVIDRGYHIHLTEAAPTCQFFDGRQAIKGVNITTVEKNVLMNWRSKGIYLRLYFFPEMPYYLP